MKKIETVLVLGAGASAPFGFPTGQALKDRICSMTLGQAKSVKLLRTLGFEGNIITDFMVALRESGRPSVDAFLEYRGDFVDIGKAAIACELLPFEKTGRLFGDWIKKRANPDNKEGNWYDYLFEVFADGVSFDTFDRNKLSIITFNYDRSIEHYLFTCLKTHITRPMRNVQRRYVRWLWSTFMVV